jgi:hypothetical protein
MRDMCGIALPNSSSVSTAFNAFPEAAVFPAMAWNNAK